MSDREKREAFVTLATNDTYSLGCLVLGHSLRKVCTSRQLVVMVTRDVSNPMRVQLAEVFNHIEEVDLLDSNDPKNLTLLGRPDLNVTFTKLHCWRMTQFDKAVFLDADTLVLQNVDELFDREELSAAPDAGWPDCFNSGVFVFKPSEETYASLLNFAVSRGSFDGGDQGLLNLYFSNWSTDDISKHLPFIYNVVSQAFYSYLPAFTQFKDRVRIVHFIGATKPWHQPFDTSTRTVKPLPGSGHSQEFLQAWWKIFMDSVQGTLDPSLRAQLQMTLALPTIMPPSEKTEPKSESTETSQEVAQNGPNIRESMEETVSTVYPFVPPKLDVVFYEVETKTNDKSENQSIKTETDGDIPKVVEVPVYKRAYTSLEANYPEEPISNINPEHPPYSIYEATRVVEGWEKGRKDHDSGYTSRNGSYDETEIKGSIETFQETVEKPNTETELVSSADPSHEEQKDDSSSEAGLAGELAHMKIDYHSPTVLLSDKERKLNWEKGQIDYLGQDSFDNIQRKLDETLNKQEPSAQASSISSPFAPKETPKEASKEVVLEPIKTVAVAPPKEVVLAPPKTVAVVAPPKPSEPTPKVTAPAPKSTAATPKTTVTAKPPEPTQKVTVAAPKPSEPAKVTAAPVTTKPTVAVTAKSTAAAPKASTVAAPKATAAPGAPAAKTAAPVTKTEAPKSAAPAPKTAVPAPKTAVPTPKPSSVTAPKTTAAPAPTKGAAAADPKASAPKATSASAPKAADPKTTSVPASKFPGFKGFGGTKK